MECHSCPVHPVIEAFVRSDCLASIGKRLSVSKKIADLAEKIRSALSEICLVCTKTTDDNNPSNHGRSFVSIDAAPDRIDGGWSRRAADGYKAFVRSQTAPDYSSGEDFRAEGSEFTSKFDSSAQYDEDNPAYQSEDDYAEPSTAEASAMHEFSPFEGRFPDRSADTDRQGRTAFGEFGRTEASHMNLSRNRAEDECGDGDQTKDPYDERRGFSTSLPQEVEQKLVENFSEFSSLSPMDLCLLAHVMAGGSFAEFATMKWTSKFRIDFAQYAALSDDIDSAAQCIKDGGKGRGNEDHKSSRTNGGKAANARRISRQAVHSRFKAICRKIPIIAAIAISDEAAARRQLSKIQKAQKRKIDRTRKELRKAASAAASPLIKKPMDNIHPNRRNPSKTANGSTRTSDDLVKPISHRRIEALIADDAYQSECHSPFQNGKTSMRDGDPGREQIVNPKAKPVQMSLF